MNDLKRRFIVSLASLAIVAAVLFFAVSPPFHYVISFLFAVLGAVAIWEYTQFALAKGGEMDFPVLAGLCFIEIFSFQIKVEGVVLHVLPIFCLFIALLVLFALHLQRKEGAILNLALSCFGLLYIAIPIGMLLGILYFPLFPLGEGRYWVAYLLIVTKIADVAGYFGGHLLGRRKLAPSISPGKTIEGALSGLLFAVAASFALHYFTNDYFHLGPIAAIVLGLALGIVGQFGDLAESLLKRDANKKDSNALPGLGGVLDSIDSLLFNVPIIYIYLNFIEYLYV